MSAHPRWGTQHLPTLNVATHGQPVSSEIQVPDHQQCPERMPQGPLILTAAYLFIHPDTSPSKRPAAAVLSSERRCKRKRKGKDLRRSQHPSQWLPCRQTHPEETVPNERLSRRAPSRSASRPCSIPAPALGVASPASPGCSPGPKASNILYVDLKSGNSRIHPSICDFGLPSSCEPNGLRPLLHGQLSWPRR